MTKLCAADVVRTSNITANNLAFMDTLLSGLNTAQEKAVTADQGPFLVIAGAGSGKTTALTRRIAYLMQVRDVPGDHILAVTFTNKAAGEMRERVVELVGEGSHALPMMGTFHSVCVKILRLYSDRLGYDRTFTILDAHDQQVLIKKVMKEMELSTKQYAPRSLLEQISRAKNNLMTPVEFQSRVSGYYEEQVGAVYDRYQRMLTDSNSMDFDDLIRLTIMLLDKNDDILAHYHELFTYILVDEYQDTNYAQYTLIKKLATKKHNLFVVGDDWQSIYRWRGADVSNILNFGKDYPEATIIKLEQNYRSTQKILDVAYSVIKQNVSRTDKKIWTDQAQGKNITSFEAASEQQEAAFIAQKVSEMVNEGTKKYSDFVILYRTNAQSRAVEEYFLKHTVPYRIVGGIRFYERKEVRDMMAYLRIILNPFDVVSLDRALSEPRRGIGDKTFSQWVQGTRTAETDFMSFALSDTLNQFVPAHSKQKVIRGFAQFIAKAHALAQDKPLTHLITHVYENSGYRDMLLDGTAEGEARHENVQELLSVASKYDDMPDALALFLEEVALASDTDRIAQETDMVHLMTLHSAKGLEFPIVFIIGLEEGLVPHSRSLSNADEMEEERRLMYVGVTRAKEDVFLLYTRQRLLFGSVQANAPSRFLDDIPSELVDVVPQEASMGALGDTPFYSKSSFTPQLKTTQKISSDERTIVKDGDKVGHKEFGEGVVVGSNDSEISVIFKGIGLKRLARDYAHLTKT